MVQLSATEILTCAICEGPIEVTEWGWNEGHNAAPVADGRCCNICQDTVVMPARFAGIHAQRMEQTHEDMMAAWVRPGGNHKKWDANIREIIEAAARKKGHEMALALRILRNRMDEEE